MILIRADVIRYWTASGSLGHDVAFSENQLKIGQRLTTKLWNAFRFVSEHVGSVTPSDAPKNLSAPNEWILHSISETFKTYNNYFEQHEFSLALDTVEKFFWHNFCDNYLELIKDQLFNPEHYSPEEVTATRWTLHHVGLRILQLYGPYIPYVTETIYGSVYANVGPTSLHQTKFAMYQQEYILRTALKKWNLFLKL